MVTNSIATVYYVDFESGSDLNNGKFMSKAWKHCPGGGVLEAESGGAVVQPDPFRSWMLPGEELKPLDIVRGGNGGYY